MDIKEFAKSISGKNLNFPQFTEEEIEVAQKNGFIMAYCSHLKWIEFDGAMRCTVDCLDGKAYFNFQSFCDPRYDDVIFYNNAITALPGSDSCWICETELPHESFVIYNEGYPLCTGIVFTVNEVK